MLARLDVIVLFNDTSTTEIYTLSLHDALPISSVIQSACGNGRVGGCGNWASSGPRAGRESDRPSASTSLRAAGSSPPPPERSEEHTSELQSRQYLVCRLLLEKNNKITSQHAPP